MDKIAIISDVHGNLIALKEVLKDIKRQEIEHIYCLGDLVAKGAEPKETVELVRKKCEVVIKGNCDDIVSENMETSEHKWNRKQIGEKNAQYLKNLPLSYDFLLSGLKVRLIHASPNCMYDSINYYDIEEGLNDQIKGMFKFDDGYKPEIVIFGHIHSPFIYRLDKKMLLNPGSVSNGCDIVKDEKNTYNLASYMILEGELNSKEKGIISYEIVKIPYDYMKEIENLKNSDMPNKELAIKELETGIYNKR